jgi:hypothetical protein
MRVRLAALADTFVTLVLSAPAAAQTACDPVQTTPEFLGGVPKLSDVVPNPGGENGEVTTQQAYDYMDAVDAASDRVITGSLAERSQKGRELRWAIIGHPDRLTPGKLRAIKAAAQTLRDPRTPEILRNALLSDEAPATQVARTGALRTARRGASRLVGGSGHIRLSVRAGSAGAAAAVLDYFGARYDVQRSKGRVAFLIANPKELSGDEHPFARRLPSALKEAGVATIAFRAP